MHLTEGIVTGTAALAYTGAGLGLVGWGVVHMKRFAARAPENKPLLGMAGALIFFISLLPVPAFTGTCSHPCGTPFAAILLGPAIGIVLTGLSLLLQAAFFAHGGFGTWGANVVALGFFGCVFGWGAFRIARALRLPLIVAGFLGGLIGDVAVYAASGFILGTTLAAGPMPQYSLTEYLAAIYAAYLPTQLPLAVGEMLLTGLALHFAYKRRPEVLLELGVLRSRSGKGPPSAAALGLILGILLFNLGTPFVSAAEAESGVDKTVHQQALDEAHPALLSGMDEAVNEHLAELAGLPVRDPYINLEEVGELWNALLLLAGGACGFVLGRWSHLLWGKPQAGDESPLASA